MELSSFPPFPHYDIGHGRSPMIAGYLAALFNSRQIPVGTPLFIPSLTAMARFFNCSQMDVYDAFQALRKNGFDYQLSDLDHCITLWGPRDPDP